MSGMPKKSIAWTNSELSEFAVGLQKYGFSEKEKIAEIVNTRDKEQVIQYLKVAEKTLKTKYVQKKKERALKSPYAERKLVDMNTKLVVDVLESPPVRKWNYMASREQCAGKGKRRVPDYSWTVIKDCLEDFYEEAEIPNNPQVIDVKSIYKFLLDCTSGRCPTELMPKESGLVLMLLKKLKEFQDSMDLEEERKFFSEYKGAVKFAPLKVKSDHQKENTNTEEQMDEDRESEVEDDDEDEYDPNAVKIPEELFKVFKLHCRLVRSFNPLMVPLWFLNKHQASIGEKLKDILGSNEEQQPDT